MPDELERLTDDATLDEWGAARMADERSQRTHPPEPFIEDVRAVAGEGGASIHIRSMLSIWAPLAAVLLIATVAAISLSRTGGGARIDEARQPVSAATDFSLFGLFRANQRYENAELALPDADVVSWVSKAPALGGPRGD